MEASISQIVSSHRPALEPLEELYKHLHAHPELSNQEGETSAHVAAQLRAISPDFEIKTGIGGHGLAAILRNGQGGKTVLLRADMDALPVLERTGLPYASTRTMKLGLGGQDRPVMHACGHDMHMTCLIGAAALLASARAAWTGTLVLAFQPAEERGTGAAAMVADGLYDPLRHGVPVPDVAIGGHVQAARAGSVGTRRGLIATSADSLRVTIPGRSAHASMPHRGVDPVVAAASAVLRLQTLVSRETDPADCAVVTVASIHAGGDAENIIADAATLAIDTRAVTAPTRARLLARIRDVITAETALSAAGDPSVPPPTFETTRSFPPTINDPSVTTLIESSFAAHFGASPGQTYDASTPRFAASEDFSILASAVDKPSVFFLYGGVDPALWDACLRDGTASERIPSNHSALFAPVVHPTLQTGLDAYAVGALTFLARTA